MTPLGLMAQRLAARYVCDPRGRLLRARGPSPAVASGDPEAVVPGAEIPRFHLVRTAWGNLWRLRADVPRETAIRLATLAGREPPLQAAGAPPERAVFIERALEQDAPLVATHTGPVLGFPISAGGFVVKTDTSAAPGANRAGNPGASSAPSLGAKPALLPTLSGVEIRPLRVEEGGGLPAGLNARGFDLTALAGADGVGAWDSGELAAVCFSRFGGEASVGEACAFVAPGRRRRGLASSLLGAWSRALCERGRTPLVSPSQDDVAACALAHGLGLVSLGEDRCWR